MDGESIVGKLLGHSLAKIPWGMGGRRLAIKIEFTAIMEKRKLIQTWKST
jgi:hypothetical protein